jgi:hypothetical protein
LRARKPQYKKEKKLSACRGEGSVAGLQLRVRVVLAALLDLLRTALALQCVSKARDWTDYVDHVICRLSATNRHCWGVGLSPY